MKKNVDMYEFRKTFKEYRREDQFSYEGLGALYDYITDMEDELGYEVVLDVIELCCNYTEYDSLKAIQEDYKDIKSFEDLEDRTQTIEFNGGIIIEQF